MRDFLKKLPHPPPQAGLVRAKPAEIISADVAPKPSDVPSPPPPPPPKPKPNGILLSAVQFCRCLGLKDHRAAGFLSEAAKLYPNDKAPHAAWVERYDAFRDRPV